MSHYLRASARPSGLGKDIPQSSSDDRPGRVFETAKLEQIRKGANGARVWGRSFQYNIGRAPRNRGIYPSFSGIKPAASSPSSLRESEQAPIPLCSSWIPRRGFAASAIPLRLRRSLPSKQKKAFGASSKAVFVLWRRRRDSNPRSSYPDTAFRVRPDRPLRHFSINCRTKVILFYVGCSLFASFFLRVKLRIGSTK
jgi:hypothetical protein